MKQTELMLNEKEGFIAKEAFNALRTNIFFSGKGIKTVVFTSCEAHEGKTTIALETCRSMAEVGKRVLLVDCDMRKSPLLEYYAGSAEVVGLSQILTGQANVRESIYSTQIPGFDVIFSGPFPPDPTRLIDSPAFKETLDEVRERYDFILIDTPPLGLMIDAALAASVCDGAILVIDKGRNNYRAVQKIKGQLEKSGCRILGAVLNDTGLRNKKNMKARSNYYYYSKKSKNTSAKTKSAVASAPAAPAIKEAEVNYKPPKDNHYNVKVNDPLDDIIKQVGLKKNPNAGK